MKENKNKATTNYYLDSIHKDFHWGYLAIRITLIGNVADIHFKD